MKYARPAPLGSLNAPTCHQVRALGQLAVPGASAFARGRRWGVCASGRWFGVRLDVLRSLARRRWVVESGGAYLISDTGRRVYERWRG